MADLSNKGLFASILEDVARSGEISRNLLAGRVGSAGRHAAQLGADIVDAVLPGNWISDSIASEEDNLSGQDLLRQYGVDPGDGILGKAAGLAVEVGTDPLSFLPGSWVAKGLGKAGALAKAGAEAAVGREAVEQAGKHIRSTFGAHKLSDPIEATVARARGTKSGVSQAQIKALDELLKGTTAEQQDLLGEIGLNLKRADGKVVGPIDPTEAMSVRDRAAAHLAGRPDADQLTSLADELAQFNRRQFEEGKRLGIFSDGAGVEDYFPRQFSGVKAGDIAEDAFGRPSAIRGRSLGGANDVSKFLAENPDVSLEFNAQKALGSRAEQQGLLASRAQIGKEMVGPEFSLADDAARKALDESIAKLTPDEQEVVNSLVKGLAPRGTLAGLLAKSNSFFKPAATSGILIPKLGFQVKNRLSTIWQTYSNPSTREATGGMVKRFFSDLLGAVGDGLGIASKDELGKSISAWEDALKTAGGSYDRALDVMRQTDPVAADLIRHGVLEGFVRTEDMLSSAAQAGLLGKAKRAAQWTSKITRGVEDRARLGLSLDLVRKYGMTPEQAAKATKESLFSYDVSSEANRLFRDIIPFGNYMAKAVPQQAEFLAKNPPLLSTIANASNGDDANLYPYMENRFNVDLGDGQVASGFGAPFEALFNVPNPSDSLSSFGRGVEQGVVGAAQPLLKGIYSTVSSRDPFFGTDFGSYDRIPLIGHAGEAGRLFNQVAAFSPPGFTAVDQAARTLDKGIDDRRGPGWRALDLITGTNLVTVDKDLALQQRLTQALARDPSVMQMRIPINATGDAETQELINQLRDVRARQKAARAAEAAKGDVR